MSIETHEKEEQKLELTSTLRSTRRAASTLERVAFWFAIVMALLASSGAITIWIAARVVSQEILIGVVGWLGCAVILATRTRWAPALVTLIETYLIYLICTQPYFLESFTNPRSSDGGLSHFIGDVLILAGAIIAFGSVLGATVRNYSGGGSKAPRWFASFISLVAGMAIGAIFIGAFAQPTVPVTNTYTNGMPTVHATASGFLQSSVTVPKGDKLLLVDDSTEAHLLFNGSWQNGSPVIGREADAPTVNNVELKANSIAIGPFTTAGTYHIFCTLHQGMNLTIIVQ